MMCLDSEILVIANVIHGQEWKSFQTISIHGLFLRPKDPGPAKHSP
jgi:hypothetical protein